MERRRGTESTTDSQDLMDLDSQSDSLDLMNITTQTEASPGPALVSNSSHDSDFLPQTTTPASVLVKEGGDVMTMATPAPGGPTIREAEVLADQMTRELLDNSDSTVRRSSQGLVSLSDSNLVTTAQEVVDSAMVEATQTLGLQKDLGQEVTDALQEDVLEEEEKENVEEPVVKRELAQECVEAAEPQHQQEQQEKEQQEQPQQEEQQHELDQSRPADDSWIEQHDISSREAQHQTFKTAFNASHNDSQDLQDEEPNEGNNNNQASSMEFTKNYSDDLLMGAGEQARATNNNDSADLADFELPPYNGSNSSGSEQAAPASSSSSKQKQSPVKQRKSSNAAASQGSSTSLSSGSSDLTAVKNILISSYSKGAHLFHWRKPIESGIIFAIGLVLIAALTFFSIISVVAYSALGVVLASGLIRIYKTSMKALSRSTETPVDHIWERVLALNVSMSPERMHALIDSSHANLNASMVYFKQVLLVEDKVATLKFFFFLYALTYIGAWFNGLTLITIIYVAVFSVPIVYEKNKTNIDQYLNLATNQISSAISLVTGRVTALIGGQSSSSKKQN